MERDLNAIKCTISAIESADKNMERYEQFRTHNELVVVPNGEKIKAIIQQMGYSDKDNPNPIYISGKSKDAILDALKAEQDSFKSKMKEKLELELNP